MKAVGIDLGTTNSLVAVVDQGNARVLRDEDGEGIVPSVVRYDAGGHVVVGHQARNAAHEYPERTIVSAKRLIGRTKSEAESLELGEKRLIQDGPILRIQAGDATPTPIEVSAEILKVLKKQASRAMGGDVTRAVITVPAYFDDTQRQATRQAGRLAGLEVMRLLNEPTAAALAYGLDTRKEGRFAIFDLGGGTFDISILHLVDGVFEVLATGGDTQLGGDDFDAIVMRALADTFELDLSIASAGLIRRLLRAAEDAKIHLSEHFEASITVQDDGGQVHQTTLSRDEYAALIQPVLQRVLGPCQRAFGDAGIRPELLDGVVLVGGSTRSPFVRRFVSDLFQQSPLHDIDPDEVVAMGAASQADLLSLESELRVIDGADVLLLDVTPLSVGLETMGGLAEKVIPRCSQIPASRSQDFTTYQDGQTAMDIHVVQGERELVEDCRSLARFQLKGIPPGPAGQARIRVTFQIDADGILRVSANELSTGIEQSIDVQPSHGLSDAQVEDMLQASLDHAEEDVHARLLRTAQVEAERVLSSLEKALEVDGDLLVDDEAAVIREVVNDLRTAMKGTDHAPIQDLTETLDKVSGGFAHRRMERALKAGLANVEIEQLEAELDTPESTEE